LACVVLLLGSAIGITAKRAASTVSALKVAVTSFGYDSSSWKLLTETGAKVSYVVISPAGGVGSNQINEWTDRVDRAHAAGQKVLGFINTANNTTSVLSVQADITRYRSFYGVDGIFLDGISGLSTCGAGDYLPNVASLVRSTIANGVVAINTYGEPADSCVGGVSDIVYIPFLNPANYAGYTPAAWTATVPAKMWHSVAQTSAADVSSVVGAAPAKNASFLNLSGGTFGSSPNATFWTAMVTAIVGSYTPQPLGVGTAASQAIVMPTYFNDAAQWTRLAAMGSQMKVAVLNVNSGPGAAKDNTIATQVANARANGITVIGYVATNYEGDGIHAANPQLLDQVQSYIDWYNLDGVYLDETVAECYQKGALKSYVAQIRVRKPGALVMLGPGRNAGECFVNPNDVAADAIVNFEGDSATYANWSPSYWVSKYPASKFWHIVYGTPAASRDAVVDLAKGRLGGLVYVSPDSQIPAYATIPDVSYFDALRTKIYGSVTNASTTTTPSTTTVLSSTSTTTILTTTTTTAATTSTTSATTTTTTTTPTSVGSSLFTAVTPARILDSRNEIGTYTHQLTAGETVAIQVSGVGGVAATAGSAVLNVTVTGASESGYFTLYPCDTPRPNASNLNFAVGQTVPNLVSVRLSLLGKACLFASAPAFAIADVSGFYSSTGQRFVPLMPSRVLDSRNGIGTTRHQIAGGEVVSLQLTGRGGITPGASAAVLNVTVTNPVAAGFVTVYPCDRPRPEASNLNFVSGLTIANLVFARLDSFGRTCLYTTVPLDLIADAAGFFGTTGALFLALVPARVLDTRSGMGIDKAKIEAGRTVVVQVAGLGGIELGAAAAMLNVTVTSPEGSGYLTIYPCNAQRPDASNLNFDSGATIPNLVVAALDSSGKTCIYSTAKTDLVIDVSGSVNS
jgi:Spherulation-specific family 4